VAYNYLNYPFGERPDVEVLVEGTWYPGELRAWSRPFPHAGGAWWGNVEYRTGAARRRFATVRSDRVRKTEPPVGAGR
jgi:hypothetical protein